MNNLKLTEVEITNFKNISKRIVHLGGKSFIISGKNASGKSSIIQAIMSPLDADKVPLAPIKKGEEKGSVFLTIAGEVNGNPRKYNIEMYFTPSNLKGRLVMKNIDGESVSSPKGVLKELIGDISFDIFEFLRKKPKEQVEQLKKLAGVDFHQLDKEFKEAYDERAYVNKQATEKDAIINQLNIPQDEIEKYSEKIDVQEIEAKIKKAYESSAVVGKVESGIAERSRRISENNERIERNKKEIDRLYKESESIQAENTANETDIKKGEEWLLKNKVDQGSIDKLNQEISRVRDYNTKFEQIQKTSEVYKEVKALKEKSQAYTKKLESITEQKAEMIKKSKLPIDGLTFNDDQVFYQGLPLEEGQINKAELIKISARIGMALNTNLKVGIVNDGSLLDSESEKELIKLFADNDYQYICEKVSDENEVDIKFIEEEI